MSLIADTVSSFLVNIISSDIHQGKQNFIQRIRLRFFKENLIKKIEAYLLSRDGTILVKENFQNFFTYNHICDKMFDNIVGTSSPVNKSEFFSSIIEQFDNGAYTQTNLLVTDKSEIIDFLSFI